MTPDSVHGDSEEFSVELPEFGHQLCVESELVAAHGAPIRGIEAKHHGPSEKIPERDMLIRRRLEGEVGQPWCRALTARLFGSSSGTLSSSRLTLIADR